MVLIKLLLLFVYALINILHAKYDAWRIANKLVVYHGINGAVHVALMIPVWIITKDWFFITGMLALRRIVFDTALNMFRGLRFDYISSTTTSIIDRLSYNFQRKYGYIPYYGIFLLIVILSLI